MGYSVATPIKSQKAMQKMLAFLRENLRPAYWTDSENKYDWAWAMSDNLDYDMTRQKIGFDYSSSDNFYGRYRFAVLCWMALRVGKKTRLSGYSKPVAYYRFDGYLPVPVLLRSVWEGKTSDKSNEPVLVDEDGFDPTIRKFMTSETPMPEADSMIIKLELARLSKLWDGEAA